MKKAIGIVRGIDNLGRIVIPKEIRRRMGLEEGTRMEIVDCGDSIELAIAGERCAICGVQRPNMTQMCGKLICSRCIRAIRFGEDGGEDDA